MTFIKGLNNLADEYNDSKNNKDDDSFNSMFNKQREFEKLITNCFNNSFTEIEETIVNPTRSFYENIKELFNDNLKKIDLLLEKEKLLKIELKEKQDMYYRKCDNLSDWEEKGVSEKIVSEQKEVEICLEDYKKKNEELNNFYIEFENEYLSLLKKNKDIEDTTLSFIHEIFVKSSSIQINNFNNQIESPFTKEIRNETKKEEIKEPPRKKIKQEKIILYEEYRKDNPRKITKKIQTYLSSAAFAFQLVSGLDLYSSFDDFSDIDYDSVEETHEKDQNETINSFIHSIFTKEEIQKETLDEILSKTENDSFISLLIDSYTKTHLKSYYVIQNKHNFDSLAKILQSYLAKVNLDSNKASIQGIINLSEKTYFQDTLVYLSFILGKEKFFTNQLTWETLLENRIVQKLQNKTKEYLKQQTQKGKAKSLFSTFKSYFKDESIENSIIGDFGFDLLIKGYTTLNRENKEKLEADFNYIIHNTFKEFIEHLCSFNWKIRDILDLIVQLASKFNLSQEEINFYVIYTNSSALGFRRVCNGSIEKKEIKQKIKDIRSKRTTAILMKYPIEMKNEKEEIIVISNVAKFLPFKDFSNFFTLNKNLSKKIKFDFYLKILLSYNQNYNNENKEEIINKRLNIWKSILEVSNFTKDFDYQQAVAKAKESISDHSLKLIQLDALRTHFHSNQTVNRESLVNILITLSYVNPDIKYYQGMNYIAAFLINLCKDEAVAFSIFYSLLCNTEYRLLFGKDLQKLKNYFFVFERMLKLYLPSVYYYFSKHSVSVHYYMTPWLITLFTNVIQYNQSETPLIILHIWDEFLIKGWKSLFASIISLISIHKEEIENKDGDLLLCFLINDLSKSDKFGDENYKFWVNEKKKFKIKHKDISNIEEEIKFEYQDNKTIEYLFNNN